MMIRNKWITILYTAIICLFPLSLKIGWLSYPKILFFISCVVFIIIYATDKNNFFAIFKKKTFKVLLITFISFAVFILFSTIINSIINNEWILSNFYEFLRIIGYFLILINYYYLFGCSKENKKHFINTLIISLLIISIIGIAQYFNIFKINEHYIRIIAPTQYVTLVNNYAYPRIVGLAGNPNVLGFFIALAIVYLLFLILNRDHKWYYIVLFVILNVIIFMTLSRTSYVCMILGELILVLISKFNSKKIINTLKFLIIIIIFNLLYLWVLPKQLTWRVMEIVNISKVESWQIRLNNSKEDLKEFNDSTLYTPTQNNEESIITKPILDKNNNKYKVFLKMTYNLIGNGPDKLQRKHSSIYDNEWVMILFRYGYIGIIFYIGMLISPIIFYKNLKKENIALYIAIIIMIFTYMIPSAVYHCDMLFGFCCILMSYALQYKNKDYTC